MEILRLENISYYSDNDKIIDKVNLSINEGDLISIVGPSGGGKSTLLKMCSDLISATEGEIYYKNKSYKNYNPIELRKQISYCIQIPYLFGQTVYDNLIYPFEIRREKVDIDLINEFLRKFNLKEEYLHKDINSLSGGEKQRIALIRNLIFTPKLILLDEVTSSLDQKNAEIIENFIVDLNKNKNVTVIWVTHDVKQSESIFDKRITINRGQIEKIENLSNDKNNIGGI